MGEEELKQQITEIKRSMSSLAVDQKISAAAYSTLEVRLEEVKDSQNSINTLLIRAVAIVEHVGSIQREIQDHKNDERAKRQEIRDDINKLDDDNNKGHTLIHGKVDAVTKSDAGKVSHKGMLGYVMAALGVVSAFLAILNFVVGV